MGTHILFESGGASGLDLSGALSDIGTLVTQCLSWITSNAVLNLIFVAGLVSIGFMVIRKAKRTAKA